MRKTSIRTNYGNPTINGMPQRGKDQGSVGMCAKVNRKNYSGFGEKRKTALDVITKLEL